ncbi:MAG: hypothetical protein IPK82_14480 [Polyangiaceae bacterium]|nr:hypothetical protein [Polyangiaceae bacterium]
MTSTVQRAALVFLVAVCGGLAASCRDNLDATVINKCPSQEVFEQSVSPFLERRCGTLDCHGGIARPMRLFGQLGLRHAGEDNVSGGKPTTTLELSANYTSVCNVDAEKMNESVDDFGNQAENLLLVTKARGTEKHKGGKVVSENDAGDRCLRGWLKGEDVTDACQEAVDQLD